MNLLVDFPAGTRFVVRSRIEGGFIDALGYLREIDDMQCVTETRCGPVTVLLGDVIAVKEVPPPPRSRTFD
ncbi:ferrous iron transport protein A [Arthrobacter sp. CAN_A1]|uniref:ferrous iron transport protein A n=1 Tax=Arthrobacter sp. CAN_A1 TaxID=2787717 RepID=UPI0018CB3EE0